MVERFAISLSDMSPAENALVSAFDAISPTTSGLMAKALLSRKSFLPKLRNAAYQTMSVFYFARRADEQYVVPRDINF